MIWSFARIVDMQTGCCCNCCSAPQQEMVEYDVLEAAHFTHGVHKIGEVNIQSRQGSEKSVDRAPRRHNSRIIDKTLSDKHRKPSMAEFLQALKNGGGPEEGPAADQNKEFLQMCDTHFPELKIYCSGKIQTSPGIEEIEGSPTEYYRTVGAMIGLVSCYATSIGDDFGLDCVSKGSRGPMSMDKPPGKFINMGNKPQEYKDFCEVFARSMPTEEDWWQMMVFLAIHDVGKSDMFRNAVNATLPLHKRSDDHDRALARALIDMELKEKFLPSILKLSPWRQEMISAGFSTNFQLPQLGQGEIALGNLMGLLKLPKEQITDGTLTNYLYHSIFDIAGASSNEKFIYPLAVVPVYMGFSTSLKELVRNLQSTKKLDESGVYFDFLYSGFRKAYPEFEEAVFRPLCESKIFRDELALVILRILALTRNTYKKPQTVLDLISKSNMFVSLIQEMSGKPTPPGPQIMLYYAPDMLRMGLGDDLADESGNDHMLNALRAMQNLYQLAREELKRVDVADYQYQLNVQPIVTEIKAAGKSWTGGSQLRTVCDGVYIQSNDMKTEGMVVLKVNQVSEKSI